MEILALPLALLVVNALALALLKQTTALHRGATLTREPKMSFANVKRDMQVNCSKNIVVVVVIVVASKSQLIPPSLTKF